MSALSALYVTTYTVCYDSEQSSEPFGPWSATYDFGVLGVASRRYGSKHAELDTFTVSFDVVSKDTVYVLVIRYGEGDSFGHACGKGEVIWVFKDKLIAQNALNDIQAQIKNEVNTLEFIADNNQLIKIGNPCSDYFTTLESLFLEERVIDEI